VSGKKIGPGGYSFAGRDTRPAKGCFGVMSRYEGKIESVSATIVRFKVG